ncbi:hypothetical protein VTK56DRAFT_1591 [Thermocarpiscus australiensis]
MGYQARPAPVSGRRVVQSQRGASFRRPSLCPSFSASEVVALGPDTVGLEAGQLAAQTPFARRMNLPTTSDMAHKTSDEWWESRQAETRRNRPVWTVQGVFCGVYIRHEAKPALGVASPVLFEKSCTDVFPVVGSRGIEHADRCLPAPSRDTSGAEHVPVRRGAARIRTVAEWKSRS